jgi:hypothetical protein
MENVSTDNGRYYGFLEDCIIVSKIWFFNATGRLYGSAKTKGRHGKSSSIAL